MHRRICMRYLTGTTLSSPIDTNPWLCSMASAPPADGGGGNNTDANSNTNTQSNQEGNNTGQEFKPESFWDDPAPSEPSVPAKGDSAADDSKGVGSPSDNGLGTAIQEQISKFQAPEVMTKEAIEAIGENGDYSKFNENMSKAMQGALEQSIGMSVKVVQAVAGELIKMMDTKIQSSLTTKDNYSQLKEAIPSAKDPAVAPMIESIYERALTLTKGDPTKAVTMTKQMLRAMAEGTSKDIDLNVAPVSPDSEGMTPTPKTNWLEALNLPS